MVSVRTSLGEVRYTGAGWLVLLRPRLGWGGRRRAALGAESRCLPLPTAYRLALVSSTSRLGGRSWGPMLQDRSVLRSWVVRRRARRNGSIDGPSRCDVAQRATCYGCSEALRTCPSLRPDGCWSLMVRRSISRSRTTNTTLLHTTDDGGRTRRDTTTQAEEGAAVGVRRQPSSALATMEECKTYRKTMLCSV